MFRLNSTKHFLSCSIVALFFAAAPAYALIDFEDATVVNTAQLGGTMTFGGFDFSSSGAMAVVKNLPYGADNGTKFFVFQTPNYEVSVTSHDHTPFKLTSLDLGGWLNFGNTSGEVKLTGQRTDGTLTTMTTIVSSASFLQLVVPADFTNLLSLRLGLTSFPGPAYVGIDNIQISPVPEPENVALFLAGLGLLGCMAKRGKRA